MEAVEQQGGEGLNPDETLYASRKKSEGIPLLVKILAQIEMKKVCNNNKGIVQLEGGDMKKGGEKRADIRRRTRGPRSE